MAQTKLLQYGPSCVYITPQRSVLPEDLHVFWWCLYVYSWIEWETTPSMWEWVEKSGEAKNTLSWTQLCSHTHISTETDLFLCCWDAVKHTLTFPNKIHACCSTGCQEWVVGVVSWSGFQRASETERRLTLRLWLKKHKKPCVQYGCTHTHRHTLPYTHLA